MKIGITISFLVLVALLSLILIISFRGSVQVVEILVFLVIGLLSSAGLSIFVAHRFDQRIKKIIAAAEKVAGGNLNIKIEDNSRDEIGKLASAFNQMITSLDSLHRSRELLSRTMSPVVRQTLIEHGLDFRGITQEVAVLFVDIRGFTRITETYHNTEQLVFFLNDYYTTIANQVHMGGGIIGKYAGDSILAFFGAPEAQAASKSTTEALLTALALQDAIEDLSQRWQILGLPPIRVGIGISLGPVVAGPIGSEEQFEYTVIGDAVNLASRLQALTRNLENYSIILSAEVHHALESKIQEQVKVISLNNYEAMPPSEQIKTLFRFVDFGEVLVRGKKGPVRVYGIPD